MAGKKQQNIRVGLYTLNEAVDTWLKEETSDYGMELITKQDDDLDVAGFDALLLMDIEDSNRAEDLYMFAQEVMEQGIHIIWACGGTDGWFQRVRKQMLSKNQTVVDIGQSDDATKLLQCLFELRESWQPVSQSTDVVVKEEAKEVENQGIIEKEDESLSEIAVTSDTSEVSVESEKGNKAKEDTSLLKANVKISSSSKFEKIRRRVAQSEGNRDQKPIVKEKFVRVGTTTIAMVNASNGSGCTYSAIQIGLYLRRFSKNVAVIELLDERNPKSGSFLSFINPQDEAEETAFHLNGIDFASTSKLSGILKNKQYDYVILDIGALNFYDHTGNMKQNKHIEELERATIGCITATGSPWGAYDLSQFLINFDNHRLEWKILLQHPSVEQKNDLVKDLHSISDSYQIISMPYQPDPFVLEEDTATELKQLLRHVIPYEEKKSVLRMIFQR